MYIWLRLGAEKKLMAARKLGVAENIKVEIDRPTGKKYVEVHGDVFFPTTEIPYISSDLIERVTFKDVIWRGLKTEGIYRHRGAELVVKTGPRHNPTPSEPGEIQEIAVSAPNLESLREIYTLVRQGKLAPEENWEFVIPSAPSTTSGAGDEKTVVQ